LWGRWDSGFLMLAPRLFSLPVHLPQNKTLTINTVTTV
jgi:hypothetical protein